MYLVWYAVYSDGISSWLLLGTGYLSLGKLSDRKLKFVKSKYISQSRCSIPGVP